MPLSRSLSPKERGAIRRCERKGGLFNTYKELHFLNYYRLGELVEGDFVGTSLADFPLVIGVRAVSAENHRFFHTGGCFISFSSQEPVATPIAFLVAREFEFARFQVAFPRKDIRIATIDSHSNRIVDIPTCIGGTTNHIHSCIRSERHNVNLHRTSVERNLVSTC